MREHDVRWWFKIFQMGVMFGSKEAEKLYQQQAIDLGHAEMVDGEFTWKEMQDE